MEPEKKDYRKTVLTPQTEFPMRGDLAKREPERLKKWEEEGLYARMQESRKDAPSYICHDGPPYANGDIHLGHALNKILKDVVVRYKTLKGYRSPYIPGWDCHGLPIEQQVSKKLGAKLNQMAPVEVRRLCHEYASRFVDIQRGQFKRIGVSGDWDRPYLTMDAQYEAGILQCLRELVAKGLVRKGLKPVHWDPVFRTALAEAEIEYEKHESDSIHVKFPLRNPEKYPSLKGLKNVSLVIWTTTPWTLPANLAVCLHPDFEYVALRVGEEHLVVAKGLAEAFVAHLHKTIPDLGEADAITACQFRAVEIERGECDHPIFKEKSSLVILGKHVTLEAGTGCVHTAPGHGMDDYIVGKQYGLPVVVPVDDAGKFTAEFAEMQGVPVFDANPRIIERLKADGILVGEAAKIQHDYPHSWRSHKPIIFRATEQWFMELAEGGVRERALQAIDHEVQWVPDWGHDRIHAMVSLRPEWCLSRQRSWGVPIPSIRSKKSGKSILDPRIMDKVIAVVAEKGTDAWFSEPLETFWPDGFVHEPTGESRPEDFDKEYDILDVWFESGASHIAFLEKDPRVSSPADMYLEGSDQHRGWFQSALLTSIGTRNRAPFRTVLTHGFLLDGQGKAMSKSLGNVISPLDVVNKMGADILRLWVCSEDYRMDIRVSDEILTRVSEAYRRIRNTMRFLIGNLYDFDPGKEAVAYGNLEEIDQWVLGRLNVLVARATEAYDTFQFHRVYHLVYGMCNTELSSVYLDVIKDRLYCSAPADPTRRAAQTVLYHLLSALTRVVAPILVFTGEEVWEYGRMGTQSVHLTDFPKQNPAWENPVLAEKWDKLIELRGEIAVPLEEARRAKSIGHSLDAAVMIYPLNEKDREFLTETLALLKNLTIVSGVQLGDRAVADRKSAEGRTIHLIEVAPSQDAKCERCWMKLPSVGRAAEHPGLCERCADVVRRVGAG